jgi:hypothetical protein
MKDGRLDAPRTDGRTSKLSRKPSKGLGGSDGRAWEVAECRVLAVQPLDPVPMADAFRQKY